MNTINIRRSVRSFTNQPVDADKIDKILRAAMQAPSGMNQQPWEFLVINQKDSLSKMRSFFPNTNFMQEAPLMFVVLERSTDARLAYFSHQALGACIENLLLEVTHLGLGACWVGVMPGEREDFLNTTFNVPADLKPFAIIAVGHPTHSDANKFIDRYDASKVHYNSF
ncbi:hypothetical protein AN643_02745 [Candidatus Epulonipiscioides saccharophilum]|nr:hypothetical protein AN643_02745 [Epulopiscium sp. SCG-B10WGA-EpuloB]